MNKKEIAAIAAISDIDRELNSRYHAQTIKQIKKILHVYTWGEKLYPAANGGYLTVSDKAARDDAGDYITIAPPGAVIDGIQWYYGGDGTLRLSLLNH